MIEPIENNIQFIETSSQNTEKKPCSSLCALIQTLWKYICSCFVKRATKPSLNQTTQKIVPVINNHLAQDLSLSNQSLAPKNNSLLNRIQPAKSSTIPSPIRLTPLNLGSTGRSTPKNLKEQLALEKIKENPLLGKRVIKQIKDPRWKNWSKMSWEENGVKIHYVAKWNKNTLEAVDDFKFKEPATSQ